jgi:hypothetical protein
MSNTTLQVGSINAGATPIIVDLGNGIMGADPVIVKVTLSQDYTMIDPPGYPFRPTFTGAATPQFPATIASGTTLALLKPEADSLVTAGAGNYA